MRRILLACAAGIALAAMTSGCAATLSDPPAPQAPAPTGKNLIADGYTGRFKVSGTVLQNEHHGPQVCIVLATSLPPQCGGPDITNWKWDGLKSESAAQTRWGAYELIGTYKNNAFTLTEPPKDPEQTKAEFPDFSSPCKPPKPATDPAKATQEAISLVQGKFDSDPDFGALWLDAPPATSGGTPMTDYKNAVLNVSFTKNIAAHEAEIRKLWGGALCVSQAKRGTAELQKIADELYKDHQADASISVSPNGITGAVEYQVFAAYAARQHGLDTKYGTGTVVLQGELVPID